MRREIEALAHPREGHAASARTARRRLEKLDRMLAAHFALEERSGRIESAVHAAPQFHPRAIALREQHRAFLAEMERIRTKARQASGPDAWMGIERAFLVLSESIRDHEMAEGEILSSAILDDLGGG